MANLPCFPTEFRFRLRAGENGRPDAGIQRQFSVIETLCNREDVDRIVNAGDSDREGEIIVRLCVSHALHGEKPFDRLWLPDQTPETVAAALRSMKSEDEYQQLADEGGNPKGANTVMFGLIAALGITRLPKDAFLHALANSFAKRPKLIPLNEQLLEYVHQWAEKNV